MNAEEQIKLFMMNNQMFEHQLSTIERQYELTLRPAQPLDAPSEDYYPQIEQAFRAEAARMAPNYEVFYSLEKTIRTLIAETLEADEGPDWWDSKRVPPKIQQECADRVKREKDSGVTPRSTEMIDYTTFGELSDVITSNWDLFGSIFTSSRAVQRVMANLNTLRGPIAHCSPLAEDEVVRLRLAVRDWFRLME
jgi:hypothetical protein